MKHTTILVVLAVALLAGCTAAQSEHVTIGFMGPLSGDAAAYGNSIKQGVELAQQDHNSSVEVVFEDSRCTPKDAVSAFNKLSNVDNVPAIIGEVCSGATLATAPLAAQDRVVMVSPSSTSPDITSHEWVYRTVPSDALQGAFGSQLVTEDGHETLAVLYSNEEYGVGFDQVLKDSFSGDIVASESFERGSVDMRTQLTKIRGANPDAIYIISNSPDSAVAALEQIRELGLDAAVYGSEGLKSDDVLEGAGSAAEGLTLTTVSSGNQEFAQRHQEAYGSAPGPFAAQGYDAFTAIHRAVEQGATSGAEIKQALTDMEFEGASGTIGFDASGDIEGNYDVFTVQDGSFVEQ